MSIVTEVDFLRYRRTKIVATIGPASADPETIGHLISAGVDVFRVNMSHGKHAEHAAAIGHIREQAKALDRHTAILGDLCGPKIRTGKFTDGSVILVAGNKVLVTTREVMGDESTIPSQYASLPQDVKAGNRILLNDGAVELRVEAVSGDDIECLVIAGGMVGDHKGINLPGVDVSAPSLTEKDIVDAEFALAQGVDFLALSFVRRADDIHALRRIVDEHKPNTMIIAKIEKPEALENSEEILSAADAIMVARGDLGVELNPEQVPLAQIQLINQARAKNKPVIVATQMLESMISAARPTRAEVTDVSLAVASGADAVMLSGETAIGQYVVETVAMMDRIARQTESYHWHSDIPLRGANEKTADAIPFGDAVADATAKLVGDVKARAVMVISRLGMTAATISAARPDAPVVGISDEASTCRLMNLMWGVLPVLDKAVGEVNPNLVARRVALEMGLAEAGEYIVLVRGFSGDPTLNTPTITLIRV